MNDELRELHKSLSIPRVARFRRLHRAGHVARLGRPGTQTEGHGRMEVGASI